MTSEVTLCRSDIHTVMIIGAGPIVIGQACEFDYSGTQACKALKAEGYKVILLNSNPATIMTDPGTADRTYIGPMTPALVEQVQSVHRHMGLIISKRCATSTYHAGAFAHRSCCIAARQITRVSATQRIAWGLCICA